MQIKLILSLLLAVSTAGCIWGSTTPPKTQLEIREFQTRDFDTGETKLVMKAILNVLQDEGFTIRNADSNLGFLAATKEVDLGGGPTFNWNWGSSKGSSEPARWDKIRVIDATANISEYGKETRVRVSFQQKVLDNLGAVTSAKTIDDAKFYQDFFSKVDKGIFLQKEKL